MRIAFFARIIFSRPLPYACRHCRADFFRNRYDGAFSCVFSDRSYPDNSFHQGTLRGVSTVRICAFFADVLTRETARTAVFLLSADPFVSETQRTGGCHGQENGTGHCAVFSFRMGFSAHFTRDTASFPGNSAFWLLRISARYAIILTE